MCDMAFVGVAPHLRDLSTFTDPDLHWMMEKVRQELLAPSRGFTDEAY